MLTVPPSPIPSPAFPGGYQGVYAPSGSGLIAFVRNVHGRPVIYLANPRPVPVRLTAGSQPDWQPILPTTTQQAKDAA